MNTSGLVSIVRIVGLTVALPIALTIAWVEPSSANEAQTAYEKGLRHLEVNELDAAVDELESAVKLDDTRSEYYTRLGEAYGRQAQDAGMFKAMRLAKKIRVSFEKAVALDPDNLIARNGLISYYLNAPAIAGGSTDKAIVQAEEIARLDEQQGRLAYARVYFDEGDEEKAIQMLREAMAADPADFNPPLILGIHYTGEGNYAEAVTLYKEFLADHPNDMSITYQLGRTASISGENLDDGEAAFQKYLQHDPDFDSPGLDWANYRLGLIYQQKNEPDRARASYEAALAINPNHSEARKALKKLK